MTVESLPAQTSGKQYALYASLALLGYNPVLEKAIIDHSGKKRLIDIAIEDLKVAIEYDGIYWHSSEHSLVSDRNKSIALIESGWRVLRMRESSPRTYLPPLGIDDWSYGEMTCTPLSNGKLYDRDLELLIALIKRVTAIPRDLYLSDDRLGVMAGTGVRDDSMVIKSQSDIRRAITHARILNGLTQKELAEKLGLDLSYVNRMETTDPSAKYMNRLFKLFEIYGATMTVSFKSEKDTNDTSH